MELNVTVGLGGHAKLGCWTPVRVVLSNPGEAALGELVLPPQDATDARSDYRIPVEAPPSSRRAFLLYARPRTGMTALRVEFRPTAGPPVVKTATCSWHDPRSRIVLGVSRKAGGLGTIGAAPVTSGHRSAAEYSAADSVVAYVTPDRSTGALGLPDRAAGYEGVTAIVLRDISPEDFEDFEREALVSWVKSGGLLIVTSSPAVAELRDSFIEELSPVRFRGQSAMPNLNALAEHFRQRLPSGRALVAATERKPDARVIVEQDGLPLLASRPSETGMACFLAADCTAPPLDAADSLLTEVWSDLLEEQHPMDRCRPLSRLKSQDSSWPGDGLSPGIVQLPILQWEAFGLLGGYLLAYIGVLVAVNLVAKRLDRREWTGQATLLVVLGFSVGAWYIGSATRLGACRTYAAGVGVARSGASVGWLEAVWGIRSAAAREYGLSPADGAQTAEYLTGARRARSHPVRQQAGFAVRDMPVDLWGFGAVRVQGPWQLQGRITARLVELDANRVAVSIENGTPYDLRWPFVLLPSAPVLMSGLIPAGETRETDPFERSRFQRQPAAPGKTPFDLVAEHSQAEDSKTAPSAEARIRHRLLRRLGSMEMGSPPSGGLFGGPSYWMPPDTSAPDPFAPATPIVAAWVRPDRPLVTLAPAREVHAGELLVLVEVPPGPAASGGLRGFVDVLPALDATARGVRLGSEGKLAVDSGVHEVRFRLSSSPRPQRLDRLLLTAGVEGSGPELEVYDYRNYSWRPIETRPNARTTTYLEPPADYVRWPWVKVRLTHAGREAATVYCALSGQFAE
ncbi:MAG: hypothetical protein FJX74_01640 [Armatimonadetes bacterium]|nr:hypothetical protein [Armatimonadota bacterium]